jgi:hypothetical protein
MRMLAASLGLVFALGFSGVARAHDDPKPHSHDKDKDAKKDTKKKDKKGDEKPAEGAAK